ncbi:uncharacterized protein TM35_000491420 [Trypanosoma theileri]|uniref:Uncharacterized protein n=1 Tax=Trypanosoma theileri TaxID=67003 RepID=A0A1X0NHI4_9TRYP|nr:uncharacterized protein TM35_000491420 [Trypanosoma theileri]ORC84136.1 hypothetical protein TM35_000491420 [Trypanosoma theileri]
MVLIIIAVALASLIFFGLLVTLIVILRNLRDTRRREVVNYDADRLPNWLRRTQHPEALPHVTPTYPSVVDACALIPNSQIKRLRAMVAHTSGNEEQNSIAGSRNVPDEQGEEQQQPSMDMEAEERESEGGGEPPSNYTSKTTIDEIWMVDGADGSTSHFPPHLDKVASLHTCNYRLKESITLLRRLSSHVVFGRAAYVSEEDECKGECHVDLPGVVTVTSESNSSCAGSSVSGADLR